MIAILLHCRSERSTIRNLLKETKDILLSPDFNIDTDYILIQSSKEDFEYSTSATMIDLDFGDEDVIATLLSLELEDYSHTLIDRDNDEPPYLFVFGKVIQKKMVYIKYKIREAKRIIICVSFHYPKEQMEFPYR